MNKLYSLLTLLLISSGVFAEINFIRQPDWKDVLAQAKLQNKYVFVDAYTDWCIWCKTMDKNTFPDSKVEALLTDKFIPVKMEMETGYGITLGMKYHVTGYPTFLVFNSKGEFVDRIVGYQKPEEFLTNLNNTLKAEPLTGFSPEVELAYPNFYKKGFGKKGDRVSAEPAMVLAYLEAQKDLLNEVNWSVLSRYSSLTRKYDQLVLDNSNKLSRLYGKVEVDRFISSIIATSFTDAVKSKDESSLRSKVFGMVDKYQPGHAKETKDNYELSFYTKTGDYSKMVSSLTRQVKEYGVADYSSVINGTLWTLYEKSDDQKLLSEGVRIMKQVIDKEPEYAYLDTYAALLYKNKQYAEAEKFALKAIEEGNKSSQDVSETKALLEKIRAVSSAN